MVLPYLPLIDHLLDRKSDHLGTKVFVVSGHPRHQHSDQFNGIEFLFRARQELHQHASWTSETMPLDNDKN